MQKYYTLLIVLLVCNLVYSQEIPLPSDLPESHPRLMTKQDKKTFLQKQIKQEIWAKDVLNGILNRVDYYVEKTQKQPDWVYSRLMMYWKSNATQVYINGGVYSHANGRAPVPTVRFGSTRGVYSMYVRPQIENIIPYMDDTKGVYFHNLAKEGSPLEWIDQSNISGGNIESINDEIMCLAKDASFIYWVTNDAKYGKFAYDILDTYLMGMYYRTEPIDIGNGHAQTLVGMSTFEVIQERILNELAYTYDFLYSYIEQNHAEKLGIYAITLKSWIDVTIKNGVPQNNWNLHQAKFILKIAMVLENNQTYPDGKGREYYIDYILNQTSARQWSLTRFIDYGYDFNTGIWNECPGYAQGVTRDLMNFIKDYDNTFNQNLLPYAPVIEKAVEVLPQYLFPNNQMTAFGDTYYGQLYSETFSDMIRIARKYKNCNMEEKFTRMFKLFASEDELKKYEEQKLPSQVSSFFTSSPLKLNAEATRGKLRDYITQTFYAPNVSWFVQRNNYEDSHNGLMISQYASYGNHAHANGIAMELYGKGYVLGAESGRGSTYFEKPYLEYYSQFPAHNTVMVDGISKYPEMLSNHPFDLLSCYPSHGRANGYYPGITYSDVYFLEPESRSDQNRLLSIVCIGETTGYYVDIFRSRKQRKGDKFHDYFYHNLGQELFIKNGRGELLTLKPSDEMTFAGGHLFALDYMWDKQSIRTDKDYQAIWKMSMPDSNHVYMYLWMKGTKGREVFSIKAPPCKAFRNNDMFPYEVDKSPYLTISARQHGEAWNHPFISVFEPTTENEGRSIESIQSFEPEGVSEDFVGLIIESKSGRKDYIFSSVKDEKISYNNMAINATYAVISENGNDFTLFLGNGAFIQNINFAIESNQKTNAVLEYKNGEYFFYSDKPVIIQTAKGKKNKMDRTNYKKIKL